MKIVLNDAMAVLRAELEARGPLFLRGLFLNQCSAPDIHIWCWDGRGAKARRQEIYPAYKAKRLPASTPIFKGLNLIRDLLKHTKAVQAHADTYEADDLIAYYVGKLTGQGLPIEIRTRDRDLQALVMPGVTCTANKIEGVPPVETHLYKSTVGDFSDNVIGIKGFGEGGWKNSNKELLHHLVAQTVEGAPVTADQWREAGVSAKAAGWAAENPGEIAGAWKVTGFLDPSSKLIEAAGDKDKDAGLRILKRYQFA